MTTTTWCSWAVREPLGDSGPFSGGKPKLVWHTTETPAGWGRGYRRGTHPHFTCDVQRRHTYQHVPIDHASMALEHPQGTGDTNRDNAVQVELVGYAAASGHWTAADYEYIAKLARWIEQHHGVPRSCGVSFARPKRMAWQAWHNYAGHVGHVHVPANAHWDPGPGFRIDLVLAGGGGTAPPAPAPVSHATVRRGDTGGTVHHLQSALRALGYRLAVDGAFGPDTERAVRTFQTRHHLSVDGVVGPATWAAMHTAMRHRHK